MVFEYLEHDLYGLLNSLDLQTLPPVHIKCIMRQLVESLAYCHKMGILHRDLKVANILISSKCELKLADFGLARYYDEDVEMTNRVITRYYRPPEILLGATKYTTAVDMWGCGCIFAELFTRKPFIPGTNQFDQLDRIFKLCGTPDMENWGDVNELKLWQKLQPKKSSKSRLRQVLENEYVAFLRKCC